MNFTSEAGFDFNSAMGNSASEVSMDSTMPQYIVATSYTEESSSYPFVYKDSFTGLYIFSNTRLDASQIKEIVNSRGNVNGNVHYY